MIVLLCSWIALLALTIFTLVATLGWAIVVLILFFLVTFLFFGTAIRTNGLRWMNFTHLCLIMFTGIITFLFVSSMQFESDVLSTTTTQILRALVGAVGAIGLVGTLCWLGREYVETDGDRERKTLILFGAICLIILDATMTIMFASNSNIKSSLSQEKEIRSFITTQTEANKTKDNLIYQHQYDLRNKQRELKNAEFQKNNSYIDWNIRNQARINIPKLQKDIQSLQNSIKQLGQEKKILSSTVSVTNSDGYLLRTAGNISAGLGWDDKTKVKLYYAFLTFFAFVLSFCAFLTSAISKETEERLMKTNGPGLILSFIESKKTKLLEGKKEDSENFISAPSDVSSDFSQKQYGDDI
ncbi:hypothetical protein L6278_01535 [Candidatus Parcubacteria bacterium]|nr:hypothetical protein [Candidatus Parcubacteria bacterium]